MKYISIKFQNNKNKQNQILFNMKITTIITVIQKMIKKIKNTLLIMNLTHLQIYIHKKHRKQTNSSQNNQKLTSKDRTEHIT